MAKTKKNYHIGGEQLPLITPDSTWEVPSELPALTNVEELALDCETKDQGLNTGRGPGWATNNGYICGLAIAWKSDKYRTAYLPISHPDTPNFDKTQIRGWLRDIIKRRTRFVYHNAAYDIGWIAADLGIPPPVAIDDTGCIAYMLDENRLSYGLDTLAKANGLPGKNETLLREAAVAYGIDPKRGLYKLPARYVGQYGEDDALNTLMLAHCLRPKMAEESLEPAYKLEMDLVPMVHAMRAKGICIDIDRCEQLYKKFKGDSQVALDDLTDKLGTTTGIEDIRKPAWLERMFDRHKISYPRTEKTGRGSFEAKWMKKHEHWLPRLITRAKSREDAAEKFVKGYLIDFCDSDARVHPTINQYRGESDSGDEDERGGGTRTYRFSYADPPLQQIPHRDEEMMEIRDAFIGEDGEQWLSCDYSQQEYRLMVHYANLLKLPGAGKAAQLYIDNPDMDFHQMVADMTGLERKPAKDCNFAKAYGAGVVKFASMIGQSVDKARAIMMQYDQRMPFVKALYDHCQKTAFERGYIKLLDGARIRFDWWVGAWRKHGIEWNQENAHADCRRDEADKRVADPTHPWYNQPLRRSRCNKAMNGLIQGGAARQTKLAMRGVWQAGYCPVLQIHDELCFSINSPKQADEIAEIMRDIVPLSVPMKVDAEIGESWLL